MAIELKPAVPPAYLKLGFFGKAGTGKSYTATKVLSQFIAEFVPKRRLAMFDSEGGAGYVAPMVKTITGKDLLVVTGTAFSELLEFTTICLKEGHVALLDSATHPWRSLVADYLEVKASRIQAAGGNVETVRLALKDWGPIKDMWAKFADAYRYDPVHWCICGREGDVWETVADGEGNEELQKVGVKMKTETETGYEPSLLVQMRLRDGKHLARVAKDRYDVLTGAEYPEPDIEFFRPHIELLKLGGAQARPSAEPGRSFKAGSGPSANSVRAEREGLLENIKDDLLVAIPGQTGADKKAKVKALRAAFGTSSWTELTKRAKTFPPARLLSGRKKLAQILATLTAEPRDDKPKE